MNARALTLVIVSSAGILPACSLLLYNDDDYAGGKPSATVEVPREAGSVPLTTVGDSSAEAAAVVGEAATPLAFTETFDGDPLGARWSRTILDDGTLALVADAGAVSAPNALRMELLADNSGERSAALTKDFPFPKRVQCSVKIRIDQRPSSGDFELLTLSIQDRHRLSLKAGSSHLRLYETLDNTLGKVDLPDARIGEWLTIDLAVDFDANRAVTTVAGTTNELAFTTMRAPTLTLGIGDPGDSDEDPVVTLFDDLSCTLTM